MTRREISGAVYDYQQSLKAENQIDTIRAKPTFLLGLPSVPLKLVDVSVPVAVCNVYIQSGKGMYTKEILRRAIAGNFATTKKGEWTSELRECFEAYHASNAEYYRSLLSHVGKVTPFNKLTDELKEKLLPSHAALKRHQSEYRKLLGKSKSVIEDRLVRLGCGINSIAKKHFETEMSHYNRSEGKSALGIPAHLDLVHTYFKSLTQRFIKTGFHNVTYPKLYSEHRNPGSDFLNNLKDNYTARWNTFSSDFFNTTLLEQVCHFYERLAKFLFNESLKTYGKDYVKIDNLGYDSVLVLCRGGPKLYKHQRSRLYRVMFPIDQVDLTYSGYFENDSFEVLENAGINYVCTPWSQLHQDIMFDYMFAPERAFNQLFSICSRVNHSLELPPPQLAILPVLLMLHNRRKTEKFLHNSRYLIVNPLGRSANLKGIIKSFADTNYTYLDAWLRDRVYHQYEAFASSMMQIRDMKSKKIEHVLDKVQLHDLWLDEPLTDSNLLTLFVYSTYMMTKAPVNSSLEQAGNLWEILQDVKDFKTLHPLVNGLDDESLRMNVLEFDSDVFNNDFKYDPVFSQYLGHYISGFLRPSLQVGELESKWDQIFESDVDTMANSNGLRGFNPQNFFNRKGYDIVYSKVDELLGDDEIQDRITSYLKMDYHTSAVAIKSDRISYKNSTKDYENLVFHIVHKIQRGGSREIFCMDYNTKVQQHPIESFFSYICKKIPNEFISIASGKRHSLIHTDFYEKKISKWVKHVVRWVLDCRRWAPHSVFQKYVHFIVGMSHILPNGFLEHFYNFAEGMFKKKFVTREHVVSKMKNNKRFEPYLGMLDKMDRAADALCMTVQFSFVMGIFNYLSTLMHAANQLVASEVIRTQCLFRGLGLVILDPKCHSDDSVVSSYHEDPASVHLSVKLYDWLLKGANHMLSVKKSQVNDDVYLEFLSTLYVLDRFLPVFPKFISTIPFKPSDEGFMSDVSFAASQAIEMLTMGGTLEEAFLIMKTTESAIRRIYRLPEVVGLPPNMLGHLDAHPLELLFSGTNTDLYNFYTYKKDEFWSLYNVLVANNLLDADTEKISFKWDMGAALDSRVSRKLSKMSNIVEQLDGATWTIQNCKLGNSTLNLLWYYLKLQDRKFRSSLVDEPVARRMSRIFGAGGYRMIKSTDGFLVPVAKVLAILNERVTDNITEASLATDNFLEFMSRDLNDFHTSVLGTELVANEPSNLKDKPVAVTIGNLKLGAGRISASEFVSYKKEPLGYKLLGKFRNPIREVEQLTQEMRALGVEPDNLSAEMLYSVTRKMTGSVQTTFRVIAPVPSGMRYLNSYSHYLVYLEVSSYAGRRLRFKNSQASSIDWNKKMVAGRMPDVAKEYIRHYWICNVLQEYNLLNKDLFNFDMQLEEQRLATSLPDEWKMILLTSVGQSSMPLADINHWIYWEKEQLRIGRNWVGSGVCVVKIPEAVIKLELAGGRCNKISIKSNHSGLFSTSSSWFLHNVLKYGAVSADFFDPDLSKINENYLGVVQNSTVYGVGRSKMFDFVIEVEWLENEPFPSEFYRQLPNRKVGNHFLYEGRDRNYYIDFFVPVEDPVSLSFKGIFDLEKIRNNSDDPELGRFIKKLSIDVGGMMEIEQAYMIDNVGSSTLYNMLYDAPQRTKIIEGQPVEDYLAESFANWKASHEDFGYPTREQMADLMKDPESPPFPRLIMKQLLKVGESNMSDMEFESLLLQLSKLDSDQKMQFLVNNFGYLDPAMKAESIVIAARSKLVYKSCVFIGLQGLQLFVPLIHLMAKTVDDCGVQSQTLNTICKNLYYSKKIKVTRGDMLKAIGAKVVYDGLPTSMNHEVLKSYQLIQKILQELTKNGLGHYMNSIPTDDPVLRTIDFNVKPIQFLEWVDDLVHGFCIYGLKYKQSRNARTMFKNETPADNLFVSIKSLLIRFNAHNHVDRIDISFKKSKLTIPYMSPIIGVTTTPDFFVLDEDSKEEYEAGFEIDDEVLDFCEEDPDADLPKYGFTEKFNGNFSSLTRCRGTAYNVFVKVNSIDASIRQIKGNVKVFKKRMRYNGIYDYLDNQASYIVFMGTENVHCTIEGYSELSFEQLIYELKPTHNFVRMIEVAGKTVTRSELEKDHILKNEIGLFEDYFKNLRQDSMEELETTVNKTQTILEQYPHDPEIDRQLEKLRAMLGRSENHAESSPNILEAYTQYLNDLGKPTNWLGTSTKEYVRANFSNFRFTEPLRVLHDLVVRSELNTFFPGHVDQILNGDLRLSKKTKNRIIRYATLEVAQMPKILKKKYSKILFIVKAVIADIEECNFAQNESLEFAAIVDQLFSVEMSSSDHELDIADLIPDEIEDKVKFDLSKIL